MGSVAIVLLLTAHVLSMLGFATYSALLPELRDLWRLTNAEAGLVGSAFYAGYVATVSYWTALTDRTDARRVYLAGGILCAAGSLGFGWLAQGLASAMLFQALIGAGLAATYMPGLRLLSDRIDGVAQSRAIAFYTSFFGIGVALSLVLTGAIVAAWGWRAAFELLALGPAGAALLVMVGLRRVGESAPAQKSFALSDFFPVQAWRRVLGARASLGYTLGYTAHSLELLGSRSWMVAFLAFCAGFHVAGSTFPWSATTIAAVVNVASVPASILGNEIALRIGRGRWILIVMFASASAGIALAASAPLHWALVIALLIAYSMLVLADSATLTAGYVAAAPPGMRGAAMGIYSLAGFTGGMLGPTLFGATLDLAGGEGSRVAWMWAYASLGVAGLAAPLIVRLASRSQRP
jgi:MFS family permease